MYNLKYISDNGKVLNFSPMTGLIISSAQGLSENSINMSESQGVQQVGTTIQSQSVQPRLINIEGSILGQATAYRKELIDTIIPLIGGTLVFDNRLKIKVVPEVTPFVEWFVANPKFNFTLRAPYPYWQALESTSDIIAGIEPKFMFPINYGATGREDPKTHIFGEKVKTYFKSIKNLGNVPTPFKVTFVAKAPLTNPKITNVKTLEFLRVEKSMVTGEQIIIDMTDKRTTIIDILGSNVTNAFSYFDIESTRFKLDVGETLIRYDADTGRDGLDCIIGYNPTLSSPYGDDMTYV